MVALTSAATVFKSNISRNLLLVIGYGRRVMEDTGDQQPTAKSPGLPGVRVHHGPAPLPGEGGAVVPAPAAPPPRTAPPLPPPPASGSARARPAPQRGGLP